MRTQISILFVLLCTLSAHAQSSRDYAVQLSAQVQSDPPRITLSWPESPTTTYFVYRKLKSGTDWGAAYATLPSDATTYTDTLVSMGVSYEYRVFRSASAHSGFGYINAGLEVPETAGRGGLLLLVDSTLTAPLEMEIKRLQDDMEMDGWVVWRQDVPEHVSVDSVKSLIRQYYVAIPGFMKSVCLLGHIAVPYAGNIAPDGHPDHNGAWPADVFYGDINGTWTDNVINNDAANDPRNDNVPGDGKFDQSLIPSDVELQVGRVDFTDLPVYNLDAVELTRNYLNRNHAFRMRGFVPENRAVVDDNFGGFGGEAFAASAYRNFATMVGSENVAESDYRTTLASGSHLLSYGCGGGSYTSCSGVGTSNDFAGDSLQSVFTMLFGSYFGDWDRQNNLMRVALAQGTTLAISWAGRPHWMYHHMALGENIGYSTRLTQNNSNLYAGNYGMRFVHVALLGDPTLRMWYAPPPSELVTSIVDETHVSLSWKAADGPVMGYRIFRRSSPDTPFEALSEEVISGTAFIDSCVINPGHYTYMVRTIQLMTTPSGSYYDMSSGISDTISMKADHAVQADFDFIVSGDTLQIIENNSVNATSYYWEFGDGNVSTDALPEHVYATSGQYEVTLTAISDCDRQTVMKTLDILSATHDPLSATVLTIYPNPAKEEVVIQQMASEGPFRILLYDVDGNAVLSVPRAGEGPVHINVRGLPAGIYVVHVIDHKGFRSVGRIVVH